METEGYTPPEFKEIPRSADLIVDFVRHGKPVYTKEEEVSGQLEGTLTDLGKDQVRESAIKLADQIDPQNEVVAVWASPKQRASETAAILRDVLTQRGIPLLGKGEGKVRETKFFSSLRDIQTDATDETNPMAGSPFWDAIYDANRNAETLDSGKPITFRNWMEFWQEKEEKGDLPEKTETPEQLQRRSMRVLKNLSRVARSVRPAEGKRLRLIVVGHEEGVRDLLEESLGVGTKLGTGPEYGEIVECAFTSDPNQTKLDISFKGAKAELEFDESARSLKKVSNA